MSGIRSVDVIGFRTLLRFHLRRELVALICWVGGTAALIGVQSVASQSFYDTPEELAARRETIGANPAVLAFAGPVELLENIGGEIVFEVFGYAAVVVALMSMLLVGRLTRTDEETGRTELIRSARVGRASRSRPHWHSPASRISPWPWRWRSPRSPPGSPSAARR